MNIMRRETIFATVVALLLCNLLANLNTVKSTPTNGMYFNPELKVVDPPKPPDIPAGDLKFQYELRISTTYQVSGWQAELTWNSTVLKYVNVTWGTFMTGLNVEIMNSTYSSTPNWVTLGQNFAYPPHMTVTGTGTLAFIELCLILPGATNVTFLVSKVWDDAMNEHDLLPPYGDTTNGSVKSNRPHPEFSWSTDDGLNPLPDHTDYDGGHNIQVYDVVHFNSSASYDPCNLVWNGAVGAWVPGPGYPDIWEYMWSFGDGFASNDIRLDPTLPAYAYYSTVRLGDLDVGWPLVKFKDFEKYWDRDFTGSYTFGDPICNDTNLNKIFDDGDSVIYGGPVPPINTFLRSFSEYELHTDGYLLQYYDAYMLWYNNTFYDASEYIYREMQYKLDLGYGVVSVGAPVVDHVYSAYNSNGWLVNLTVWDGEGDWWSTTWRCGGPKESDIVPMWRDVGIVGISPSLPPYELWQEWGWDWWRDGGWWFNTVDYWIPYTNDPYWDYVLPDSYCDDWGIPVGTNVKTAWTTFFQSAGLYLTVFAQNYGTVPEKVRVELYAIYMEQDLFKMPGGPITPDLDENVYQVGSWTRTMAAGASSGFSFNTIWMPPKNGTYAFLAILRSQKRSVLDDQNSANDYFLMPETFTNIARWNFTLQTLVKQKTFGTFMCDLDGSGNTVGALDLAFFMAHYSAKGWAPKTYP